MWRTVALEGRLSLQRVRHEWELCNITEIWSCSS